MLSSAIVAATLSISISEEEFTVQVLSPIYSTSMCPYLPLLSGSVEIEGKVSVVDRKQSALFSVFDAHVQNDGLLFSVLTASNMAENN